MQDCYVGDIGDFGKYGLLRWLCGMRDDNQPPDHGGPLSLGVLWYRFEDGSVRKDSKFNYLKKPAEYEQCDPKLFGILRTLVCGDTLPTLEAIEASKIFWDVSQQRIPTTYFSEELNISKEDTWGEKEQKRVQWITKAIQRSDLAQIVFADPNTGLEISSTSPICIGSNDGRKYAYYHDLLPCWKRGQTLVFYQHNSHRKGGMEQEISRRLKDFSKIFDARDTIVIRWPSRAFFVLPTQADTEDGETTRELLKQRIKSLTDTGSPWHGRFTLFEV